MSKKIKIALSAVIAVAGAIVFGQGVNADDVGVATAGAFLCVVGCLKLYQEFD